MYAFCGRVSAMAVCACGAVQCSALGRSTLAVRVAIGDSGRLLLVRYACVRVRRFVVWFYIPGCLYRNGRFDGLGPFVAAASFS